MVLNVEHNIETNRFNDPNQHLNSALSEACVLQLGSIDRRARI